MARKISPASALLAATALVGPAAVSDFGHSFGRRRRPRPEPVVSVPCPRCGAAVGEPCDPRTLGKWPQHAARLEDR